MKKYLFFLLLFYTSFSFAQGWIYAGYTCHSTVANCQEWLSSGNGAYLLQGTNYTAYSCMDIYNIPSTGTCAVLAQDPCPGENSEWNQEFFTCETPSICDNGNHPQGSVYNSLTESCECPAGQSAWLANGAYACAGDPPQNDCQGPESDGYQGTMNGQPICEPPDDACPEGQSGGFVNGAWTCIPEPPQCSPGETYINGACIGPEDYDEEGDNGELPDDDGDGQPNLNDDDIDGDGQPNSSDSDRDGDGIGNDDDPTPDGEQESEKSATTSGTCDARPSCQGDAIQCAILIQSWQNHCDGLEGSDPLVSEGTDSWWESEYPEGLSGVWSEKQAALQTGEMASWVNSFSFSNSGSCPSFDISIDLGFMNLGGGDLMADYCYVFDFIRIVMMVSATLLSRRLVFGG